MTGAAKGAAGGRRGADLAAIAGLAAVLLPLLWLVGRPLATDDLWWHMKLGEVYAREGPWLAGDPLYHTTEGRPTVPHEWLFQVAAHAADRTIGLHGLRIVHVTVVLALLVWAFRIFRRAAASTALAALATAVLAVLSWYRLFQLRPDLASLAALLGLVVLLFEPGRPPGTAPGRGRVAAALALLGLWANLHSLVAIGLALLLAALLGVALHAVVARWLVAEPGGARAEATLAAQLGAALVLGLLVTALNPRGFEQHATFFVESASGDIWHLEDDFLPWNPLRPAAGKRALTPLCWGVVNALLLAWLATAGAGLVRVLRRRSASALRDLDALYLGLSAAGLVAMLVSVRFHWMAFLPLLYLLRAARRAGFAEARGVAWAAAAASLALGLVFPAGIGLADFRREVAHERDGYLRSAWLDARYAGPGVRFLRDAGLEGRLAHPFNMGGFLAYWLAPRMRTFIDGRMDHYPSEVLQAYLDIRNASAAGALPLLSKRLDEWKVDVVFAPGFPAWRYADRDWIAPLRRLPAWIPIFASHTHSVYLRRGERNLENLKRVLRYYGQRGLPFSPKTGVAAGQMLRRRPNWARRQGIVPPHFDALERDARHDDPARRAPALDELAEIFWRIGAFEEQVRADRQLVALAPDAPGPRRRLADGLLHLGRAEEALALARALQAEHPDTEGVGILVQLAAARVRADRAEEATPRSRAGAVPRAPRPTREDRASDP